MAFFGLIKMIKATINSKDFEIEFSNKEKSGGTINGTEFSIDSVEFETGSFHIIKENKGYVIRVIQINRSENWVELKVNGNSYKVEITSELDQLISSFGFEKSKAKVNELKSSMPGKVIKILIKEGGSVEENEPVLILEAMKMENLIKSPVSGEITTISVKEGDTINKGDTLIKFK